MSESPRDMDDCEVRGQWGYQYPAGPSTRPRATVDSGGAPLTSSITQSTDNSSNKLGVWVALACLFGGLGFGCAVGVAMMVQGQIQSEGRAVRAEMRSEFEARFADLNARVKVAEYEASIAKTNSQRVDERDKLRYPK